MSATSEEIIDGQVVDGPHALAVIPAAPTAAYSVAPQVQATELVARLDAIREAMKKAMVADVDYGVIPGTQKPTLLKPGAEKLAVLFQFDVQTTHDERWGPGDHLTVVAHSTVFHIPTGARCGGGEGLCSTREKKYGKRQQQRACPSCGGACLFKSKKEAEWFCWAKKGGCGATFPEADPRIVVQATGEIENPELPDTWNTVVKMARKRSLVDAILLTTGASAIFTQDAEDQTPSPEPERQSATAAPTSQPMSQGALPATWAAMWERLSLTAAQAPATASDPPHPA